MLHLAFTERALLADEMGLGKTIQAIAACALLHRMEKARHVLVVTPASLKSEGEEQIQRFTALPYQLVFGAVRGGWPGIPPHHSLPSSITNKCWPTCWTSITFYVRTSGAGRGPAHQELGRQDHPGDQALAEPGTFLFSQARRSKNRLDELYSLMDFLNPSLLGPLFRFNREYYELDDRGRPSAYRNLDKLRQRVKPLILRRRKADVETELPERTDRNFFVPLSAEQQGEYDGHEGVVAKLASMAQRRPLTQPEQDKLMRHLNMMRMVCDTDYILKENHRACPKLKELEKILEECRDNQDVKVIIFSEWTRMLELARDLCQRLKLGFAWHTGSVPQKRRRAEINVFKSDPNCRVFLSTDSGAAGLNLQNASVVVNCDLPWNPAKLEQRIARAWRKHQTRPVTVINLISENTIEHRMLETLSIKQALSDGVLDLKDNLSEIKLRSGRQAFLSKLQQLITQRRIACREPHASASSGSSAGFRASGPSAD